MLTILQRLQEMPYNMVVRVARKFRLQLDVDETQQSIINRLDEVISDYIELQSLDEDVCIDGELAKYNLLADFEVPNELVPINNTTHSAKTISYIDMMLIDNAWCYLYWDISQFDNYKITHSDDFEELLIHINYRDTPLGNLQGVNDDYTDFISVSLEDKSINYYQQYHYVYCNCQLVAKFQNRSEVLCVSSEVFLPHVKSIQERFDLPDELAKIYCLSVGNELSLDVNMKRNLDNTLQNVYPILDEIELKSHNY